MRLSFLVPAAALTLAACQPQSRPPAEEPGPPAAEATPVTPAPPAEVEFKDGEVKDLPQQCNAARPANVSLTVKGQNGDAFRVIMTCGGQEVARCSATVATGPPPAVATANCSDGPKPAVNGPARCVLGVGNGNSPVATAPAWGCLN